MMPSNKNMQKIYGILSLAMIIGIWKILTIFFSPFVVPPISEVCKSLVHIFTEPELYKMIGITVVRQLVGITIGVGVGMITGFLMGISPIAKGLISPVVHLFQTVPPVSWVVLALVWFGFNGKPSIFIIVIATIPIIAINVCEGIEHIPNDLIEMAKVYDFSKKKIVLHIVLPFIKAYFHSGFRVAFGNGWKIAVMGEVLTTSDGIGGMIKLARLNVEPENIVAWSIVSVLLFFIFNSVIEKIFFKGVGHA